VIDGEHPIRNGFQDDVGDGIAGFVVFGHECVFVLADGNKRLGFSDNQPPAEWQGLCELFHTIVVFAQA
jgi:hypothetical protein